MYIIYIRTYIQYFSSLTLERKGKVKGKKIIEREREREREKEKDIGKLFFNEMMKR